MLQEYTQAMKDLIADKIRDIHTVIPGKIVSFDPDKCEASIQPLAKYKKPNGSMMDFPQLNEVPILFPQSAGQTATIVYPVRPDDYCLVFVSEQTLDTWRTDAESGIDLRFDLSNAVAVVGLFVKPNPLVKEACGDNSLIIEKDGERVRLKKGETYVRDTAGQSITLTPNAVTVIANNVVVKASGNASIQAGGDASVEAGGNAAVKASGNAGIQAGGGVSITAPGAMTITGNVAITGNMSATGDLTATGDVTAGSISLKGHTHKYNPGPGSSTPTAPPE